MIVRIKKLNPDAVIPFKSFEDDFCYDCVAVSEEEIAPNVWRYGLGFSVEIVQGSSVYPEEDYNFSLDFRPRSSIWKTGMVLSNSVGTVDVGYRGEIFAIFYHVFPNMPRYKVGDKICQFKLGEAEELEFEEVTALSETKRGTEGFGSTGN